jgi:hypothetical protein
MSERQFSYLPKQIHLSLMARRAICLSCDLPQCLEGKKQCLIVQEERRLWEQAFGPRPLLTFRGMGKPQPREKACSQGDCLQRYPLTAEYFYRCRSSSDGFDSICKKCRQKRYKEDYELKQGKYAPRSKS